MGVAFRTESTIDAMQTNLTSIFMCDFLHNAAGIILIKSPEACFCMPNADQYHTS